jgi:hypothetical protein
LLWSGEGRRGQGAGGTHLQDGNALLALAGFVLEDLARLLGREELAVEVAAAVEAYGGEG